MVVEELLVLVFAGLRGVPVDVELEVEVVAMPGTGASVGVENVGMEIEEMVYDEMVNEEKVTVRLEIEIDGMLPPPPPTLLMQILLTASQL